MRGGATETQPSKAKKAKNYNNNLSKLVHVRRLPCRCDIDQSVCVSARMLKLDSPSSALNGFFFVRTCVCERFLHRLHRRRRCHFYRKSKECERKYSHDSVRHQCCASEIMYCPCIAMPSILDTRQSLLFYSDITLLQAAVASPMNTLRSVCVMCVCEYVQRWVDPSALTLFSHQEKNSWHFMRSKRNETTTATPRLTLCQKQATTTARFQDRPGKKRLDSRSAFQNVSRLVVLAGRCKCVRASKQTRRDVLWKTEWFFGWGKAMAHLTADTRHALLRY